MPKQKAPREAGLFVTQTRSTPGGTLTLDLDLDAAVRRETCDQRLALLRIRLVADDARNRLRLAHAERLDLVARHAAAHEVIANRIGATLGQALVVRLRADAIGVAGDEHELELRDLPETADDLVV